MDAIALLDDMGERSVVDRLPRDGLQAPARRGGVDRLDPHSFLRRRAVPLTVALILLVTGMLFELLWIPVVYHQSRWFTQSDMWGMFRAAHYIGWGDLGGIYTPDNGVVTFPGTAILLTPVAVVSGWMHLTESFNPYFLSHPTAVLLLLPFELVLASTVVFGADSLAEEIGVTRRQRVGLCIAVGVLAWPTAAVWGHAEDALTMAFACYGLRAVLRGRWVSAGWLLGCAIVIQPLAALMIPVLLAASPRGQRFLFAVRCSALSAFTVGVSFLGDPRDTYRALIQQPTPPSLNHPTPWVALAPRVIVHETPTSGTIGALGRHGVKALAHPVVNVSGGPGRTVYVILALVLGLYVWRRPQEPMRLLWLASAILAARCFFEAVMTPYYLAPPLFLLLVLAARRDARWFRLSVIVALGISCSAYRHLGEWRWWLPVVTGLSSILVMAYPHDSNEVGRARRPPDPNASAGPRQRVAVSGGIRIDGPEPIALG